MENAADALKMAAAMLIFIMALTIAIVFFGKVRSTSDYILNMKDRETQYVDGNSYYNYSTDTERIVGMESIIPTIYRAYLENYIVVFKFSNPSEEPLYYLLFSNNSNVYKKVAKYSLDLETNNKFKPEYRNAVLGNDDQKREFLMGVLYHKFLNGKSAEDFQKKFYVELPSTSLFERIKNKKFKESLGLYYQDDNKDTPEVMKTEKRIITYTEV